MDFLPFGGFGNKKIPKCKNANGDWGG